jgi:hypothetical protein
VVLALRPSTPAPREQRQPKREQRAAATDSEAHGIPAGPVFRLRRGLRLEGKARVLVRARASFGEDGEVGVKPDPFKPTDAEGRWRRLVVQPSAFAFD